jgi:hypothetical protein
MYGWYEDTSPVADVIHDAPIVIGPERSIEWWFLGQRLIVFVDHPCKEFLKWSRTW